jgi:hypothetical protein
MDTCHSLLASVKQHCIMVFLFFAFGIGGVFIVFSRVDRPGRYTKVLSHSLVLFPGGCSAERGSDFGILRFTVGREHQHLTFFV